TIVCTTWKHGSVEWRAASPSAVGPRVRRGGRSVEERGGGGGGDRRSLPSLVPYGSDLAKEGTWAGPCPCALLSEASGMAVRLASAPPVRFLSQWGVAGRPGGRGWCRRRPARGDPPAVPR